MSVAEQVMHKLAGLTAAEQKKVLEHIEFLERWRDFDFRAWALEQFTEEEFLAGMEDIRKNGGHSLEEILPELERLVAESEPRKK